MMGVQLCAKFTWLGKKATHLHRNVKIQLEEDFRRRRILAIKEARHCKGQYDAEKQIN